MPDDDLAEFRCVHGHLFLGCPLVSCEEQNAYVERQQAAIDAWNTRAIAEARAIVREGWVE